MFVSHKLTLIFLLQYANMSQLHIMLIDILFISSLFQQLMALMAGTGLCQSDPLVNLLYDYCFQCSLPCSNFISQINNYAASSSEENCFFIFQWQIMSVWRECALPGKQVIKQNVYCSLLMFIRQINIWTAVLSVKIQLTTHNLH